MGKFTDLTGKRFGRLVIIKRAPSRGIGRKRSTYWFCKCNCGIEKEVRGQTLVNGRTKSCGCLIRETTGNRVRIEYGLAAKRSIYIHYRYVAKKKNISFDLSFEQFIELTHRNCYYCGSSPSNFHKSKGNGDFTYNGIDRKDNTNGYTIENCVPCCDICNKAKRNLTYEEFTEWIKKLSHHALQQEEIYESGRIFKNFGARNNSGFASV